MRRDVFLRTTLLVLAVCAAGCYESEFPLDVVPQVETDPRVMGSWRCIGAEPTAEAITLTLAPLSPRRYEMTWQESTQSTERFQAYASSLRGTTLVNVREVEAKTQPWLFISYAMLQPDILSIRVVNERLLKGVVQSQEAIRKAIEQERLNPALYADPLVCLRVSSLR